MAYKDLEKRNTYFRARYRENQEYVQKYKTDHGCADCGYNEHHAALEFDHVEPRLRGTVSSLLGRSLKMIEEEIARCEVVCSNHHSIRTWERGWKEGNKGWRNPAPTHQ